MKSISSLLLMSLLSACTTPRNVKDNHSSYVYTDNSVRTITTNTSETYYFDKNKDVLETDEEFQRFKKGKVKVDNKGQVNIDQDFDKNFMDDNDELPLPGPSAVIKRQKAKLDSKGRVDLNDLGF